MTDKIFHKILDKRIHEHKSRLLFQKRDGWSWKQITWLDYDSEVRSIASYLLDLGFSKGDHVLIVAPNGLECTFVESAVLLLGGICIPVSEDEQEKNIKYILNDNDIRFVFASNEHIAGRISNSLESTNGIDKIFTFSDTKFDAESQVVSYKNVVKFGFLKRKKLNDTINELSEDLSPLDNAFKIYSFRDSPLSRTITHEMLIKLMDLANKKLRFITSEDQSFSLLSNSDSFSRLVSFLPLYIGNRGAMAAYEQEFYKDVKEIMPTIMFLSSDTLHRVYEGYENHNNDAKSLKDIFGGRVRYVFTDYLPVLSVKSRFIDSGISIIELNELARVDS